MEMEIGGGAGILRTGVALGLLLTLTSCCVTNMVEARKEAEAIRTVQEAIRPGIKILGQTLVPDTTWKEYVESAALADTGSLDGYEWQATRNHEGLGEGEWFVSFVKSNMGHFWVVDTASDLVLSVNEDAFVAYRTGMLREPTESTLSFEFEVLGIAHCSDWSDEGWCYVAKGRATNVGEPIVSVSVESQFVLSLGDKVYSGEINSRGKPDAFRRTSVSKPWRVGDSRTFEYHSDIIPYVYGQQAGDALGYLKVNTETLGRGGLVENFGIQHFDWPVLGE